MSADGFSGRCRVEALAAIGLVSGRFGRKRARKRLRVVSQALAGLREGREALGGRFRDLSSVGLLAATGPVAYGFGC